MNRIGISSTAAVVVVAAMLLFGALDPMIPAFAAGEVLTWLYAAGWVVVVFGFLQRRNEPGWRRLGWYFATFAACWIGLLATYLANPTHQAVAGVGLLPVSHFTFLPGSVHAEQTSAALRFALAALPMAGCAMLLNRTGMRVWMGLLIAGGLAMAALALVQRLTPKAFPVFERTGVFVSENHYAAFANLIFPLCLAAAVRVQYTYFARGRVSSPAFLLYGMAAVLAASVWYSGSRAGLAITLVLTLAFAAQQVLVRRRYPFLAPPWPTAVRVLVLAAALAGSLYALAQVGREWFARRSLPAELQYRSGIIADTWSMWLDRPWWGVGPGAYASAFVYYQDPSMRDRFIRHAHHEPAEMISEYGLLGLGLLGFAAAGVVRGARALPRGQDGMPSCAEIEVAAFALGFAGCLLHGLVDFPLRTPLIGLMMSAYAGTLIGHPPRLFPGVMSRNERDA